MQGPGPLPEGREARAGEPGNSGRSEKDRAPAIAPGAPDFIGPQRYFTSAWKRLRLRRAFSFAGSSSSAFFHASIASSTFSSR